MPGMAVARVLAMPAKTKFGEGVLMRYDGDKVIVPFDTDGEKGMVTEVVLENRLMDVA